MPPPSSINSWHDARHRRSESPTPTRQIRPPRYSLSSSALSYLRPISVESPSSCTSLSAQATQLRPPHRSFRRERRRSSCKPSPRSEEHTSELQSRFDLVCRLLLEQHK